MDAQDSTNCLTAAVSPLARVSAMAADRTREFVLAERTADRCSSCTRVDTAPTRPEFHPRSTGLASSPATTSIKEYRARMRRMEARWSSEPFNGRKIEAWEGPVRAPNWNYIQSDELVRSRNQIPRKGHINRASTWSPRENNSSPCPLMRHSGGPQRLVTFQYRSMFSSKIRLLRSQFGLSGCRLRLHRRSLTLR